MDMWNQIQPRTFVFTLYSSVAVKHRSFENKINQRVCFHNLRSSLMPMWSRKISYAVPLSPQRHWDLYTNSPAPDTFKETWGSHCVSALPSSFWRMSCGNTGGWKGVVLAKKSVMMVTLAANNNTLGHASAAIKVPEEITNFPFQKVQQRSLPILRSKIWRP